jgi:hypothetical protein
MCFAALRLYFEPMGHELYRRSCVLRSESRLLNLVFALSSVGRVRFARYGCCGTNSLPNPVRNLPKPVCIQHVEGTNERSSHPMPEPLIVDVAERTSTLANWTSVLLQTSGGLLARAGVWATDISQRFGGVVSALMGPTVVLAYIMALWSLTANIGWTGTFMVSSGPLSNWMVWLGIAVVLHGAAAVLKRNGRRS